MAKAPHKKNAPKVRTPEGAEKYGQSIGETITKDAERSARKVLARLGFSLPDPVNKGADRPDPKVKPGPTERPASEIAVGDMILTHDGTPVRVTDVQRSRFGNAARFYFMRNGVEDASGRYEGDQLVSVPQQPRQGKLFAAEPVAPPISTTLPNIEQLAPSDLARGDIIHVNGRRRQVVSVVRDWNQTRQHSSKYGAQYNIRHMEPGGNAEDYSDGYHTVMQAYDVTPTRPDADTINTERWTPEQRQARLAEAGYVTKPASRLRGGDRIKSGDNDYQYDIMDVLPTGNDSVRVTKAPTNDRDYERTTIMATDQLFPTARGRADKTDEQRERFRARREEREKWTQIEPSTLQPGDLYRNLAPGYGRTAMQERRAYAILSVTPISTGGTPNTRVEYVEQGTDEVQSIELRDGDSYAKAWRIPNGGAQALSDWRTREDERVALLKAARDAAPVVTTRQLEANDVVTIGDGHEQQLVTRIVGNHLHLSQTTGSSMTSYQMYGQMQEYSDAQEFHRITSAEAQRREALTSEAKYSTTTPAADLVEGDVVFDGGRGGWATITGVKTETDGRVTLTGEIEGDNAIRLADRGPWEKGYDATYDVPARPRSSAVERRLAREARQKLRAIQAKQQQKKDDAAESARVGEPAASTIGELSVGDVYDTPTGRVRVERVTPTTVQWGDNQREAVELMARYTYGAEKGQLLPPTPQPPNAPVTMYPAHPARELPELPAASPRTTTAGTLAVGDVIQQEHRTTTPNLRPVTLNPDVIDVGTILPAFDNAIVDGPLVQGRTRFDRAYFPVVMPDGTRKELTLPDGPNVALEIKGVQADMQRARNPMFYGDQVSVRTDRRRVDSVRVLANGKIRIKGEYITESSNPEHNRVGEKFSELLPPGTELTAIQQRRNSRGELMNARQAARIDAAQQIVTDAEASYDRQIARAAQDAVRGTSVYFEDLQPGDTIKLGYWDAVTNEERPKEDQAKLYTYEDHTTPEGHPPVTTVVLTDPDGKRIEMQMRQYEQVQLHGAGALRMGTARVERNAGSFLQQARRDFAEVNAAVATEGTFGGLPVPRRRRTVGGTDGVILANGRERIVPDTLADMMPMEDLFDLEDDELADELEKLNGFYGPEIEMRIQRDSISSSDGDYINWNARLFRDGYDVGHVERTYHNDGGTTWAYNDYLEIPNEDDRGVGFGSNFYSGMESWYRESGVERMEIHAALADGGYAWAKAGFDWHPDTEYSDKPAIADHLRSVLRRHSASSGNDSYDDNDNGYGTWNGKELDSDGEYMDSEGNYQRPPEDEIEYPEESGPDSGDLSESDANQLREWADELDNGDGPTPFEIASFIGDNGEKLGDETMRGSNWHGIYYFN